MTKQSGYATKQTGYFWTKQLGLNIKASLGVVSNVITTGQLTSAMRLPIWLVYICAPIGYGFIEIRLVEHLVRIFCTNKKNEEAGV